ncbi:hypothetical protein [Roseovarius phycicola]|uniref:Uncharacterized protein n=1 Tax=Roseovarius phycicola TaxID=3080976 RepID=A0ABZ2HID1_9RHOB
MQTKLFGYWISAVDESSAKEAVKMAGLPILIMGANVALLTLVSLVQPVPNLAFAGVTAFIALLLFVLAFRIRAGHASRVPVAVFLFVAFFVGNAVFSYWAWKVLGSGQSTGAGLVMGWIVPTICMILVVAGLRGWIWLKANKAVTTF